MYQVVLLIVSLLSLNAQAQTRVAVLDTGVVPSQYIDKFLCSGGHKDFTGEGLFDTHGHGTNVASLIARHIDPKSACLMIVKWTQGGKQSIERVAEAIRYATDAGAKYINLSLFGNDPSILERLAIERALNLGVTVVVAAGNDGHDLTKNCDAYPACYSFKSKNFYVVTSKEHGKLVPSSNYGGPVNGYANGFNRYAGGFVMSGTSQACAIFTGRLIQQREHYEIRYLNNSDDSDGMRD